MCIGGYYIHFSLIGYDIRSSPQANPKEIRSEILIDIIYYSRGFVHHIWPWVIHPNVSTACSTEAASLWLRERERERERERNDDIYQEPQKLRAHCSVNRNQHVRKCSQTISIVCFFANNFIIIIIIYLLLAILLFIFYQVCAPHRNLATHVY